MIVTARSCLRGCVFGASVKSGKTRVKSTRQRVRFPEVATAAMTVYARNEQTTIDQVNQVKQRGVSLRRIFEWGSIALGLYHSRYRSVWTRLCSCERFVRRCLLEEGWFLRILASCQESEEWPRRFCRLESNCESVKKWKHRSVWSSYIFLHNLCLTKPFWNLYTFPRVYMTPKVSFFSETDYVFT